MGLITKPYTFSNGATIIASEHNSNFDTLYNLVNGGLDTANLSATALIALSQISWSQAITMTGVITMSGASIKFSKGADVASAAGTITLGDDGNMFDITGTAAITSITAKAAGTFVMLQFDSTATLTDGSNLYLNGNFTGATGSTLSLVSDGTGWFEVCRSPVSFTPTASNALSGSVIQTVNTTNTSQSNGTTVIPADDTTPLITEGVSAGLSRAITPNNTSNLLEIEVIVVVATSNSSQMTVALFQDATSAALISTSMYIANTNQVYTIPLKHYMTAGTTSSTTFTVRFGCSGAGTFTINGLTAGNRVFGGVCGSMLTIREIKA